MSGFVRVVLIASQSLLSHNHIETTSTRRYCFRIWLEFKKFCGFQIGRLLLVWKSKINVNDYGTCKRWYGCKCQNYRRPIVSTQCVGLWYFDFDIWPAAKTSLLVGSVDVWGWFKNIFFKQQHLKSHLSCREILRRRFVQTCYGRRDIQSEPFEEAVLGLPNWDQKASRARSFNLQRA